MKRKKKVASSTGTHRRNTSPMLLSHAVGPACTRRGTACRAPAVSGKQRCRMHGGARGSGAPKNNRNAFKHGHTTREAIERRARLRGLVGAARELISKIENGEIG